MEYFKGEGDKDLLWRGVDRVQPTSPTKSTPPSKGTQSTWGKFKGKVFFWGNLCGGCLSTTMLEFVSINTTHLGRFVSTTVCVVSNIQSLSYVYVDNILFVNIVVCVCVCVCS